MRKKSYNYKFLLFHGVIFMSIFLLFSGILSFLLEQPIKRFPHPHYPFLHRYTPHETWKRKIYGDLARMLNAPQYQEIREIQWKTDQYGFLNSPAQKRYDIITIGDSYTGGSPIDQSEMWPNVFCKISKHSVYNLGHPAEGPWHELMNWKIESQHFQDNPPSWVIWGIFAANDLDDPYQEGTNLPASYQPRFLEKIQSFVLDRIKYSPIKRLFAKKYEYQQEAPSITEKIFPTGRPMLFLDAYATRSQRTYDEIIHHPNYVHFKNTILEFNKMCVSEHIKLAIVLFPCKYEIYEWLYNNQTPWSTSPSKKSALSKTVQEICESNNIVYLDLYQPLLVNSISIYKAEQKSLWWYDDTHMNAKGNYIAALTIFQKLWRERKTE